MGNQCIREAPQHETDLSKKPVIVSFLMFLRKQWLTLMNNQLLLRKDHTQQIQQREKLITGVHVVNLKTSHFVMAHTRVQHLNHQYIFMISLMKRNIYVDANIQNQSLSVMALITMKQIGDYLIKGFLSKVDNPSSFEF